MRAIALALSMAAACALAQAEAPPRATIRVGVWTLWHDREVTLTPVSGAMIQFCASCPAEPLDTITLHAQPAQLVWTDGKGVPRSSNALLLTGSYRISAHHEFLTLAYPLKITAQSGSLVLAVSLPVERYVEYVVAAESGAADSSESLKALSVVARSFALAPAHGHTAFDVCDSTHCQWVHWQSTRLAHAAAMATAGESLWIHGLRAEAYFHQNCGGRTASAAEVWPKGGLSQGALVSRTDPYCARAGSSEWSATLSRSELTQALAAAGLVAPGWKRLTVAQRGASGRAISLMADGTKIPAEDFRLAVGRVLGWNRIRSNWFEVAELGDGFLFHGRGSGHGVGLCQAGAAQMAHEGHGYREILAQYFPGATVADESTGAPWQRLTAPGFALETSSPEDKAFLPALERALGEAESLSGISPEAEITVKAYRSTSEFRSATLAPGWVAGFTEGDWIALQPLRILAARKLLPSIARHEFLHALIEEQASAQTPLWLREGLVEAWSGERLKGAKPTFTLEAVNEKLAHARSEAESESAHQAAAWYAQQLLQRYGRAQVLDWLRAGLPQSAFKGVF
jgi:stage II sporulation protein D